MDSAKLLAIVLGGVALGACGGSTKSDLGVSGDGGAEDDGGSSSSSSSSGGSSPDSGSSPDGSSSPEAGSSSGPSGFAIPLSAPGGADYEYTAQVTVGGQTFHMTDRHREHDARPGGHGLLRLHRDQPALHPVLERQGHRQERRFGVRGRLGVVGADLLGHRRPRTRLAVRVDRPRRHHDGEHVLRRRQLLSGHHRPRAAGQRGRRDHRVHAGADDERGHRPTSSPSSSATAAAPTRARCGSAATVRPGRTSSTRRSSPSPTKTPTTASTSTA